MSHQLSHFEEEDDKVLAREREKERCERREGEKEREREREWRKVMAESR